MISITRYHSSDQTIWDRHIKASNNGTFLLLRSFMEYHSDRYQDHSVMLWKACELLAVLPANILGNQWYSHQGLSYAGLIWKKNIPLTEVCDCWLALLQYAESHGFRSLYYKPVPLYYRQCSSNEDAQILFWLQASLQLVESSSVVQGYQPHTWRKDRKSGLQKAIKQGISIQQNPSLEVFWDMLSENLWEKYRAKPVHTLTEIYYLQQKFPQHIHLLTVGRQDEMLGGVIIFETAHAIQLQYTASNPEGRKHHAIDFLFDSIFKKYASKPFVSLGTSRVPQTIQVNESLQSWKESWRTSSFPHEHWLIDTSQWRKLEGRFSSPYS